MIEHFYQKIAPPMIHPPEIEYLRGVVAEAPPGSTLVELGTNIGYSTAFLLVETLNAAKGLRFVTVDNWSNNEKVPDAKGAFLRAFRAHGALNEFEQVEGDSAEAAKTFADRSVFFVFVDADHTQSGCERDIRAWTPKITLPGILAGHDYPNMPGVAMAVLGAFGKGGFRHVPPSIWEKRFE